MIGWGFHEKMGLERGVAMVTLEFDKECNRQLDRVIESRRSVRSFTDDVPPRELIEQVLQAGLLAPYASAAIGSEELFRRFIVIEKGRDAMAAAADTIRRNITGAWEIIGKQAAGGGVVPPFAKRLKAIADGAPIGFEDVPYYIVVAELKGVPPVEQRSLAHVLENMWLKATALGLGFRLISATTQQEGDPEFCALLGIPPGKFGLDGCCIGYPTEVPPPTKRPALEEVTTWLS